MSPAERDYRRKYFQQLFRLQGELVKLQDWVAATRQKVVILFEGRDAAGKGGAIKRITQKLNPRVCRVVALPAPNDRERTQWYFQRYVVAPAGSRRDRAVRSQLVQPRRRRARDGLLHRRGVRGVLPLGARVRAHAGALRHPAAEVLVLHHRRGAARAIPRPHPRSAQAMEALAHGPGVAPPLGGLHQGQGNHAGAQPHSRGALVGGAGRGQEARAPQLHRSPAQAVSVRRDCPSIR